MSRTLALLLGLIVTAAAAQDDPLIVRPDPPALDDFETDADADGVPDGWYNGRDVELVGRGGVVGPSLLRFHAERPSRPARISRGFGVDGRETESLVIGLWVRRVGPPLLPGERLGEEPMLLIDLLDAELQTTARGQLGPWNDLADGAWVHWVKRVHVPPTTRDAIMTVGLLGATGTLEIDGLTIEERAVQGERTTNLIVNPGFERGGRTPDHWIAEGEMHRVFPGYQSDAAIELTGPADRALVGVGEPVEGLKQIGVSMMAGGRDLRAGGARAAVYFLDDDGKPLPGASGGALVARWSGSFPWQAEGDVVPVPTDARWAVVQVEKTDRNGALRIDDVEVVGMTSIGGPLTWNPYHVEAAGDRWPPYEPADAIEPGSALDFSYLLEAPAGTHGFVTVKDGRLAFEDGTPARFFGVSLVPPFAFARPERIEALADRLARSGVNLVRLDGLDAPLGPGMSILDDVSSDTSTLDPLALDDLDRFVATMKERGIYVAIELQGQARFREGDPIADGRALPPGGGPAAAFDPAIRDRIVKVAEGLLTHENPETGLALKDDPALAWVALAGELSIFDLLDDPTSLPESAADTLRGRLNEEKRGLGRTGWKAVEGQQWAALAGELRELGLKVPIAGSSHWRREREFAEAQAAGGLDLVDDRLYWAPPRFAAPDRRTLLRVPAGELIAMADAKRAAGKPYVAGQYASYTEGVWALPYEGADLLLAAGEARAEGWDGLVRRGVARLPERWGEAAPGTGGGLDTFVMPEVINGNPQVFDLLPHAADLFRSAPDGGLVHRDRRGAAVAVDSATTQGVAGWAAGRELRLRDLAVRFDQPFGVVVASSVGPAPIAEADRLLVTAVARVQPTGLEWVDHWHREAADPGHPPLRAEPFRAEVTWRREGPITAYTLDNAGRRLGPVEVARTGDGSRVVLVGDAGRLHWELVAGSP